MTMLNPVSLVVKQDFLFSCFDCLSISPENIKINLIDHQTHGEK